MRETFDRGQDDRKPPRGREWFVRLGLFGLLAGIYLLCPVSYWPMPLTLTTGEVLLTEGRWNLDGCGNLPTTNEALVKIQVRSQEESHYYFPPGGVVSSLPVVAVARACGWSSLDADRNFLPQRETFLMAIVAALVTAGTGLLLYELMRTWLSVPTSLIVALVCGLGTQLLSTCGTTMWSQTWCLFFETLGLLLLVRGRSKTAAVVFVWAFFCRPTIVLIVLPVAVYLFWKNRNAAIAYVAIGAVGFALFVGFSYWIQDRVLPVYYCQLLPGSVTGINDPGEPPIRFEWWKLGRDLFSPSRGLFICVPVSLVAIWLGVVAWRKREGRSLLILLASMIVLHLLMLAFHTSGPGCCFGARYTTDLVPLLAIAAALGLRAKGERLGRVEWVAVVLFVVLSVSINLVGACSERTARWTWSPDLNQRVWHWHDPQWLAPLTADDAAG